MPTFIMLTEAARTGEGDNPSPADDHHSVREARKLSWWLRRRTQSGPWCAVDIFEAPNLAAALLISARISELSGRRTELWPVEGAFAQAVPTGRAANPGHVDGGYRSRWWHRFGKWTGRSARPHCQPGLEPVGEAH